MSASLILARRSLAASRVRLAASIGGVALALSLTLALDAIFSGVANQLTTYIDRAGADIWVAQAGVRNLHMVASAMPETVADQVRAVAGVEEAMPILYSTDTVSARGERAVVYVIGLPDEAAMGAPWDLAEGSARVPAGGIIVDRGFAARAGIGIGDPVIVLGGELRVTGLSRGTASLVNAIAFVAFDDFRARRGNAPVVSYLLVRLTPGGSADAVAAAIEREVPGVTATSRAGFAAQERRVVNDMAADVISIMNVIGFVVALAVVALTVYIAVLGRRREYGVLKALGAPNRTLYRVVVVHALLSVAAGFAAGLAFTALIAVAVSLAGLTLELSITAGSLLKVGLVALVVAGLAALLPVRQIAGLDPATVFRKGAAS